MAYKSLIKDTTLIHGDSSEINMFSTNMADDLSIDWEAEYTIAETLGDVDPLVRRVLPLNEETTDNPANKYFVHQITPTESALMTPGTKYYVTIEIRNDVIGYKGEVAQYKLKCLQGGVL